MPTVIIPPSPRLWTPDASPTTVTAVSSISRTGVFTAGSTYRIRARNLKVSASSNTVQMVLLDDTTELTAAGYYINGIKGANTEEDRGAWSNEESAVASSTIRISAIGGSSDALLVGGTDDGMGVCLDLELYIAPTPATDDILVRINGLMWGGCFDTAEKTYGVNMCTIISSIPRTTPPDGIKFNVVGGGTFSANATPVSPYIAIDTLDSSYD